MISKAQIKWLNSLSYKKFRDAKNVFTAEGERLVRDLVPHFRVKWLGADRSWIETNKSLADSLSRCCFELSADEMRKITQLNTPGKVYCVFERKKNATVEDAMICDDVVLALDRIQDPGNLGTIIRTADWFGIRYILCSKDTADVYNPKVVQSTMGALARVNTIYCNLENALREFKDSEWTINGTFLDGDNLYKSNLKKKKSVIVMGNEGNGISKEIETVVNSRIKIPSYPEGAATSESLNVAMATGIILAELRKV